MKSAFDFRKVQPNTNLKPNHTHPKEPKDCFQHTYTPKKKKNKQRNEKKENTHQWVMLVPQWDMDLYIKKFFFFFFLICPFFNLDNTQLVCPLAIYVKREDAFRLNYQLDETKAYACMLLCVKWWWSDQSCGKSGMKPKHTRLYELVTKLQLHLQINVSLFFFNYWIESNHQYQGLNSDYT